MKAKPILVTRIPVEYGYEGMRAIIGNVYRICKNDYLILFTSGMEAEVRFELLTPENATELNYQIIQELAESTGRLLKERIFA